MTAFADLVNSHAAAIAAAKAKVDVPFKPATTAQELMGLAFLPGARVLDKVTGEEGVVIGGTIKHTLLPAS
jgi:hypothetical protein